MDRRVFVISGGELGDPARLREALRGFTGAVICADRGVRALEAAGGVPDLIVGDLDSLDPQTLARHRARGGRVAAHPRQKDETDTELALHEAFSLAPAEVWIWAALGGRVDHALANISLLWQGVARGVAVRLVDAWCELFLITGRLEITGEPGQTLSLFPFAGEARGVTLTGVAYPLRDAVMAPGHPYGVSNRFTAPQAVVTVGSGCLLAVRYFRPGGFPGEERP